MATHFSILAWRIPWIEEPGGLQSRVAESDMTEATQHAQMLSNLRDVKMLFPEITLWYVIAPNKYILITKLNYPYGCFPNQIIRK